eukprot:TRINITY_DN34307_c0_g1_i1.p1 TRINITY_DN34307_c0_g1~~TRINITY_DN34307_c0_g1_i1.p1  ORF type:complete len:515 (+),score=100.40 TRINITY_DN34307_c0_g1_i1:97-1641(+)
MASAAITVIVCLCSVISAQITAVPTLAPAIAPTGVPTAVPTIPQAVSPSAVVSAAPTAAPTATPANASAEVLGVVPTASPSAAPAESKDAEDTANADVSVVALLLLVLVMFTFYFVKAPAPIVVENTWSMISAGASIFCAVLANDISHDILQKAFDLPEGDEPTTGKLVSSGALWVGWWLFAVMTLYKVMGSPLHLAAYGTILGHLLGFAGISFFGLLCLAMPELPWYSLVVYGIYVVSFLALFASGSITRMLPAAKEDLDRWHDQVKDTGTDFFCMTGSFILSFFVRYLIMDPERPTIDGSDSGLDSADVNILLTVGIVMIILAGAFAVVAHRFHIPDTMTDIVGSTLALLSAWCCLFGANWAMFNNGGATVLNRAYVASIFSTVAFFFIVLMAGLIDHCEAEKDILKGMFTAVSLTVGMGWEKTFDACMDGLGDYLGDDNSATWIKLVIFGIVFPAWVIYILPQSNAKLKNIPAQHFWVCCPCAEVVEEDFEGSDEEGQVRTLINEARDDAL